VEQGGFRLGPIDLELRQGERLTILGRNGVGKTTLLSALLGALARSSGTRWVGPSVVFAAIPQGARPLSRSDPLLALFTAQCPLPQQQARSLLAKFGLGADHVRRAGRSLSPGERTRATLALLVSRGVNTLALDEPTNHLDLEARNWLEEYLHAYPFAVILVSHDRFFLDAVVTRIADLTLRTLTERYHDLDREVRLHDRVLQTLTQRAAPELTSRITIGTDSTAELLLVVGDNPGRIRSDGALAKLCGACPIPASSGKTPRRRLNRGGHRQANAALYRILALLAAFQLLGS